jgi:hypothetical protein
MRLKASFPELPRDDPSAKNTVPASPKVEGYLLSEAEYIRTFGY